MIKNVAIVSLSAGTIGEDFVRHEVEIGIKRLKDYGLNAKFMPHALKGIDYVKEHPAERAADLLEAFRDQDIDMILCAIGGDDTYRLLPYLFEHDELADAVSEKVFLGFSDTTINHLMLHKLGLKTFYCSQNRTRQKNTKLLIKMQCFFSRSLPLSFKSCHIQNIKVLLETIRSRSHARKTQSSICCYTKPSIRKDEK